MTEEASSPKSEHPKFTPDDGTDLFLYDSSWVNPLGRISITSSFHMFPRTLKSLRRNKAVFYSYLMQNQGLLLHNITKVFFVARFSTLYMESQSRQ
jgi:hypothetical protein